ncbi:type IV pilus biogenesis/stability protein PilW [Immundisolibacter sp.]|uniref:type IV pilus biogenesis/stability protein PilW n=1 Tax=Immundisolibacter sp. TaxID=1934948 RepID=UPI003567036D
MRNPLLSCLVVVLLGGCASRGVGLGAHDASGGELAINLEACSQVGDQPRHKPSKQQRLAELHMALGAGYLQEGVLKVALTELEESLALNPRSAQAHATMALLQLRLNKPQIAERHYRKALALDPSDPEIHNNYGVYLCGQDRWQAADAHFRCAIANPLYRTPAMAYSNAAECSMRGGDTGRAEIDLRTAAQIDPSFPTPSLMLARLNLDQGNAAAARTHLTRYMRHAGQTPAGLALGIKIETSLGDLDRAASYRMLLKNRFPDSREAQELH